MPKKLIGGASVGDRKPQILFLTLAEVDDRSFGGAMRSNDLRSALSQAGNVDTLVIHGASHFSLDTSPGEQRVRRATFSGQGLSVRALLQRRRIAGWVANTIRSKPYDVIVARYLGLALFVPLRYWRRLVLDADDIFKTPSVAASTSRTVRMKLGLRNAVAAMLLRLPRHVWVVNPLDGARLRSQAVSQRPNAVSLPAPSPTSDPPTPGRFMMVGYLEHPPNAEGLEWFASRILPKLVERFPGVELHAIGKVSPRFAQGFAAPVAIRGFVDDLASEYARAALVIAPIHSGGGTQIKVLEALAHGRPLISSAFAQAGFAEHLVHGEHLMTAGSEEEWLDACEWALQNPALSESLGAEGQRAVHRAYGTDHMVAVVRRTIDELVGRVANE